MRTDADDLARVRDAAMELLLSHHATLTGEWSSRQRPGDNVGLRIREIPPPPEGAVEPTRMPLAAAATLVSSSTI